MSQFAPGISKGPFKQSTKEEEADASTLDRCGDAIISLILQAAGAAHENEERATDTARQLGAQLKASEDRVAQLEAELQNAEDRASHAERWLLRVHEEIEQTFLDQNNGKSPARIVQR
jgi:predicted  nucleic acid-binding Zn-ribbon protein